MKEYNKLVRDKIPEIISNNGEKPSIKVLNDEEYKKELDKKILEEVNEYLKDDNVEELADIAEVILAILAYKNVPIKAFEEIRNNKAKKRVAFNDRIFLEYTE